jgi:hypothetical protein
VSGVSSIVSKILGGVAGPVVDYLNERQKLRSAERLRKAELADAHHQRQVELARDGMTADANWEMEFARQAASSWKDEYTLLVVSIPLVMAFVPGLDKYVNAGFESFASTPLWYQVMVQTMFYATVGIKFANRFRSDT